ncbi:MAG: DUF1905 domain-containing protein [Proteobacteria bacterium]|nr:DUF1905 domain-containing protein [Pseudomonadota bacterium]
MQKTKLQTEFSFKAKLWKYEGPAGWCFVTIPKTTAKRIRAIHHWSEEGWGRLKTTVTIGSSIWKTSIWFDTKADSYLLPVKVMIRKKEKLVIGRSVSCTIDFNLEGEVKPCHLIDV